ncbi:MAG: hypothetical protein FJY97_05705 [candidate division Zixibacteria bacterium]|nr:hypothetical protein [candidate division Zixibacteria bacterium]
MRVSHDLLPMTRDPLSHYGNLEAVVRGIREHRPLDLNAEQWHKEHPSESFDIWAEQARGCLLTGLHYDPGPLDLRAEILDREEREDYIQELVLFNTTPWIRVAGYFL